MKNLIRLPERGLPSLQPKAPAPVPGNALIPVNEAVTKTAPEKKALLVSYPASMFWDSALRPFAGMSANLIRGLQAYRLAALCYACMRYRATKLAEPPLWIREEKEGGEVWIRGGHEISGILEQPNPDFDMQELLEIVSLYLDGTGRVLLVKNRDNAKRVGSLYPFHSDEFVVKKSDSRLFGTFEVNTFGGRRREYGPDDVIFIRNVDPANLYGGMAPLEAALSEINLGADLKEAARSQLKNKIRPGAIATFPQNVNDEEFERLKAEIRENYGGVQNDGKTMILDAGGKLDMLSGGLKDMELGPLTSDVETAICSAFGVHPAIVGAKVGIENSSGLSDSLKPATKLFYDLHVIPAWTKIEKAFTRGLLRPVDDNPLRFVRFDRAQVRELQQDLKERTDEASSAAGYWLVNEQRVHTGLEPLPDDDPRGTALGRVAAPSPFAAAASASGDESADDEQPEKRGAIVLVGKDGQPVAGGAPVRVYALKLDERKRLWRRFDAKARRDEEKYAAAARAQFAREKADILKILAASSDEHILAALDKVRANYGKRGEYYLAWIERYEKLIATTFDVAGSDLAAEIGFDFSLENPAVQLAIRNRTVKLTGEVTRTSLRGVREAVSSGRREGEGIRQISKRIQEVFSSSDERATLIARTETIGALNEGEFVAAQESGVIRSKEWLDQGDDRVRESHRISGERVPVEGVFSNGLLHPGDQAGPAEEVCNCRCGVLYHDEEA